MEEEEAMPRIANFGKTSRAEEEEEMMPRVMGGRKTSFMEEEEAMQGRLASHLVKARPGLSRTQATNAVDLSGSARRLFPRTRVLRRAVVRRWP